MKILHWIDDYLEMAIGICLILTISVVLSIQVFMRYVVHESLSWSEELSRYMFIWLIYLGISYGAKVMRHIKIDAGLYMFPKRTRPYIVICGDLIFLIFSIVVVIYSLKLVNRQIKLEQVSPAIGIPMYLVYLAPAVGFFLTSIREVQTIIYRIKKLKSPCGTNEIGQE
ncbi:MAG: TRAP transporter small permease [Succinatimonas hippei]|nr:TRAP transporter small permease [Succinatimonas hippei]